LGVQDVAAVVVAIAVLDRTNRNLLLTIGGATAETTLASEFVDSAVGLNSGAGYVSQANASTPAMLVLMQQNWLAALNSTGSGSIAGQLAGSTSVPAALATKIAGAVRIYQRYFYLNSSNTM
jgi:hypothetical protein